MNGQFPRATSFGIGSREPRACIHPRGRPFDSTPALRLSISCKSIPGPGTDCPTTCTGFWESRFRRSGIAAQSAAGVGGLGALGFWANYRVVPRGQTPSGESDPECSHHFKPAADRLELGFVLSV